MGGAVPFPFGPSMVCLMQAGLSFGPSPISAPLLSSAICLQLDSRTPLECLSGQVARQLH